MRCFLFVYNRKYYFVLTYTRDPFATPLRGSKTMSQNLTSGIYAVTLSYERESTHIFVFHLLPVKLDIVHGGTPSSTSLLEAMFFAELCHRHKRHKNFQTNKADTNQIDNKIDSQYVRLQLEQYYVYNNRANS